MDGGPIITDFAFAVHFKFPPLSSTEGTYSVQ